jgi:leucine dehydrogenase
MTLTITDITGKLNNTADFDRHEKVIMAEDPDIRFKAFVAIHNTSRGPALGGCRYWSRYKDDDEAVSDVLRLSRGMTYKNALAGLPLGGGKAVIIGTPGTRHPTPDAMRALARAVDSLQGKYITAEDVGMSVDYILVARGVTRHVAGLPIEMIAGSYMPDDIHLNDIPNADPSPYTAFGVFESLRAAVAHVMNRPVDEKLLDGVRVSVKGYGNVARTLCRMLSDGNAKITVSEIDDARAAQASADGFHVLDKGDEIMAWPADIYAPCALGGDINDITIPFLAQAGVKIIAGCANNQLAKPHHADELRKRDILYVPDYVANAGGVISVGMQHVWSETPARETFPTHAKVIHRVRDIHGVVKAIFERADMAGANTAEVANQIAEEMFKGKKGASMAEAA